MRMLAKSILPFVNNQTCSHHTIYTCARIDCIAQNDSFRSQRHLNALSTHSQCTILFATSIIAILFDYPCTICIDDPNGLQATIRIHLAPLSWLLVANVCLLSMDDQV
eukprot:288736_1